jgi:hypothetical protein
MHADIKKIACDSTLPFDYFIKGLTAAKFRKARSNFTTPSWYNSVTNSVTYEENKTDFNQMSLSSSKPIRPELYHSITNSAELSLDHRIYIHASGKHLADSIGVAIIFTKNGPTSPDEEVILTIKAKTCQKKASADTPIRFALYRALLACPLNAIITLCLSFEYKDEVNRDFTKLTEKFLNCQTMQYKKR